MVYAANNTFTSSFDSVAAIGSTEFVGLIGLVLLFILAFAIYEKLEVYQKIKEFLSGGILFIAYAMTGWITYEVFEEIYYFIEGMAYAVQTGQITTGTVYDDFEWWIIRGILGYMTIKFLGRMNEYLKNDGIDTKEIATALLTSPEKEKGAD